MEDQANNGTHLPKDTVKDLVKMIEKRVKGYLDEPRMREELVLKTYEYDLPFNYPNVTVWRKGYDGGEFHGIELSTRNAGPSVTRLTEVTPGEWMQMKAVCTVPPLACSAEFRLDINDVEPDETLWIADAFAGTMSEGAANLISNPTFAGGPVPPEGWRMDVGNIGSMTHDPADAHGHTGLKLQNATISLYSEFPASFGQTLMFSLWVKSTNPYPKTVWLYPKWKNDKGMCLSENASDCIIVDEDEPIVRVAIIGSACTPPGYVTLEAVPEEEFYRRGDFVRCTAPLRFRQNGLWGMHLRVDQWSTAAKADFGYEDIPEGMSKRYPGSENLHVKSHYQEFPFAGMSSAVFEIPKSRRIIISGGSEALGWQTDNAPDDDHYSFRTIRVTVDARKSRRDR